MVCQTKNQRAPVLRTEVFNPHKQTIMLVLPMSRWCNGAPEGFRSGGQNDYNTWRISKYWPCFLFVVCLQIMIMKHAECHSEHNKYQMKFLSPFNTWFVHLLQQLVPKYFLRTSTLMLPVTSATQAKGFTTRPNLLDGFEVQAIIFIRKMSKIYLWWLWSVVYGASWHHDLFLWVF